MSTPERPGLPQHEKEIGQEDAVRIAETALEQTGQATSNRLSRVIEQVKGLGKEAVESLKAVTELRPTRGALMVAVMELVAINYIHPELADKAHERAQENGGLSGMAVDNAVYLADYSRVVIDYAVSGGENKGSDLAWGEDRPESFR